VRTLSSTLLAAQRSSSSVPSVKVEVSNRIAGVARPLFARHYTGAEVASYHGATMPGNGSLVRVRVESGGGNLYVQRVANPGSQSNFSGWTSLGSVSPGANVALCSQGAQVMIFYVDVEDGASIYYRESNDNGATWNAPAKAITPVVTSVRWVAAAIKPGGAVALFYASDTAMVYVMKRSGGSWGNPSDWSNSVSAMTGMVAVFYEDWDLVVTGTNAYGDHHVWTCIYGDGVRQALNTWSSLRSFASARSDSLIQFHNPFLVVADVLRLTFVEKHTGAVAYQRPLWSHSLPGASFADQRWREAVPFNLDLQYGLALAGNTSRLWLSTPSGVWEGNVNPSPLDVSNDVVSLMTRDGPSGAIAQISLRNDGGRYNQPGSGALAALQLGSQVAMSPGYRTSQGEETSPGPACWITGWEHLSRGGTALFALRLEGAWGLLARWSARQQYTWQAGDATLEEVLRFLLARVGLDLASTGASTALTTYRPALTVYPGDRGDEAVRRLLAQAPDVLRFRGALAVALAPGSSDPTDYSYGATHPLLEGRYANEPLAHNRLQVYGPAGMAERFAWLEVERMYDRLVQVHDLNLDTQAKLEQRGDALLGQANLATSLGEVNVPVNCGQELYDVVEVTDPRAGLTAARYRVQEIELTYRRQERPAYSQRLGLTRR